MKRIFISQPMKDKTDTEIKAERQRIIGRIKELYGDDIEIIDSYFENAPDKAAPLWFLGKSFEKLSTADVAFFAKGWENARGCRMEYLACREYSIDSVEV